MNEAFPPFDESQLSEEDLAILRTFEAMEDWEIAPPASAGSPVWVAPAPGNEADSEQFIDEIFTLFLTEINDDIATIQQILSQLEQEGRVDPAHLIPVGRVGHKMRGAASAMECHALE